MNWYYEYTPYIWPILVSATLVAALVPYSWRRRSVPGALPFAILLLFILPWIAGNALELMVVDVPAKIFWVKFQAVWLLPIATARLCFALEYCQLDRWLTRRNLAVLSIPPLFALLLILTNDAHHLIWQSFQFIGYIHPQIGNGSWLMLGYGYLTVLAVLSIFIWRFIRSPLHRWPVAVVLCGVLISNMTYVFEVLPVNLIAPMDPLLTGNVFNSLMFAIALFGFRMFDPIQVARKTVIEQMQDGMLVLDTQRKIVDLNPAAENILALPASRLRGRDAVEVLPDYEAVTMRMDDTGATQPEISLGTGCDARIYTLHLSPLKDRHDHLLGQLLLMSDITAQKRAQAQILEQQRALATASERERLARELHDSIGQVLGYAGFQVEAVRKQLADGQTAFNENQISAANEHLATADNQLARLGSIIQEAHADVREYILNLSVAPSAQQPFFAALRHYLDGFTHNYGIQADLVVGAGLDENTLAPGTQMQVFRIAQEALSNARKHADARCVQVTFEAEDHLVRMLIQDNGRGFDPAQTALDGGNHFGLRFMRERAEQLGGRLWVESAPAQGTRVIVEVPKREATL